MRPDLEKTYTWVCPTCTKTWWFLESEEPSCCEGKPLGHGPKGRKDDEDKLRFDLLPPGPLEEVVGVLTFGAKKYEADNWKEVPEPKRRYLAASLRHIIAWMRGEKYDPESGRHHLAHAACGLLFVLHFEQSE